MFELVLCFAFRGGLVCRLFYIVGVSFVVMEFFGEFLFRLFVCYSLLRGALVEFVGRAFIDAVVF